MLISKTLKFFGPTGFLHRDVLRGVPIVLGGTEIGLGAYYHPDRVPRAMLTLSTSLSQYELFGEMEASLGSDRRFVETTNLSSENPFGLRTMRYPESVFAAATGGGFSRGRA